MPVQEYLRALPDVEPSAAKPQATPAATPAKEQEPEEAEEKEEGMEVDEDGSAKKKVGCRGWRGGEVDEDFAKTFVRGRGRGGPIGGGSVGTGLHRQ